MFCGPTHEKAESDFRRLCRMPYANPVGELIINGARRSRREAVSHLIGSGLIRLVSAREPESMRGPAGAARACKSPQHDSFRFGKHSIMSKRAEDSLDYNLRLYVAGQTPRSIAAVRSLRRLCEKYLSGRYSLDVIDLASDPSLAQRDRIIAIPTLVRHMPEPIKRIIGDLSNGKRVLMRLGVDVGAKV